jgi:hypothetical protein
VCVHILTGKPLYKTGHEVEKHLQYVFCVLGTPRAVGYKAYSDLPLANAFPKQIIVSAL